MLQQVVYVLKFRRIKPAYMKCFLLTDIGEENSKLSGAKLVNRSDLSGNRTGHLK